MARPNDPAWKAIRHVFVLMLENRSFDHMLGHSGLFGIDVATPSQANLGPDGAPIAFHPGAADPMPTDPRHEFPDVVEQLCGKGAIYPSGGGAYPPIHNAGFAANYARTFPATPAAGNEMVRPIMAAIDTKTATPALWNLAREFVVCDRWFSSLPGPTFPNRFFVHGASSCGLEHSPSNLDLAKWELFAGFRYPRGSIYDALGPGKWRLYQDDTGPIEGRIPQVAAIKGVHFNDVHDLGRFASDLAGDYPAAYTFIEPSYGAMVSGHYRNGTSQHPMDTLAGGDRLIAQVYNALRASRLWEESLLIVTYDEHGGFYDHVAPDAVVPPGDSADHDLNRSGFDFARLGVRVPAVLVSPRLLRGGVDHAMHDHSSVVATLGKLCGFPPLTQRDAQAHSVLELVLSSVRRDCPQSISSVPGPLAMTADAMAADALASNPAHDALPVEDGSTLQGFLYVVRKAQAESRNPAQKAMLAAQLPIAAESWFHAPRSRGEARAYVNAALPALLEERAARQA
ncbi:alkaline phosphatase family protein [Novosphingobium sp.]|uniref:alkaline phosphatase family protein n=1 Tax=Novosphingobium sp. TaxID=1874826 RepID=UPI0025D349EF|nr:alkaline phosphatase family protein [Novosphingobium sp.]